MPDIQTEMQKILQSWDTPETTQPTEQPKGPKLFTPTNNVSQQTFNFIRDNAGCTRVHAIQKLVRDGHKKSSVSSLIGQMLRQGHIYKGSDGTLYANGKEYTPLKSAKTIINREKKAKTFKVKTPKPSKRALAAAAEAMGGINMLVEPIHTRVYKSKIETILDDISLSDAHELYRKLHQYFGGLPK